MLSIYKNLYYWAVVQMEEHLALIQKVASSNLACPVLRKKDMEMQSDNKEPDPFKSRDFSVGFTQRKIAHDLKSCVYGYCEVSSGRTKSFC